jgi:hypothetical protein
MSKIKKSTIAPLPLLIPLLVRMEDTDEPLGKYYNKVDGGENRVELHTIFHLEISKGSCRKTSVYQNLSPPTSRGFSIWN